MNALVALLVAQRFKIVVAALAMFFFYLALRALVLGIRALYRWVRRTPGWKVERPDWYLFKAVVWGCATVVAGTVLAFAFTIDALYQPIKGANKSGIFNCSATTVAFTPASDYPGKPQRVKITRRQWAVEGHFITFGTVLQYAGLRSSHRLVAIVGRDAPALPEKVYPQATLGKRDPFFEALRWLEAYLPVAHTRTVRSQFLGRGPSKQTLFVFEGGYSFLVPVRPEDL